MSEWIEKEEVLKQIDCWFTTGEYKYSNATHYLNKRISSIKPKSEWISIKDRLPDTANGVIVCDEFGLVYPACYYTFDKCWMNSFTDERCGYKITHWMPLPEPPKEDDAE